MRYALVAFVFAACAPKEDYTPQIEVQPHAERRLCYPCIEARSLKRQCPPEIREACAALVTDVPRLRVILTGPQALPE